MVPRTENMAADTISKLASSSTSNMKRSVMIEILPEKSIDTAQLAVNTISHGKQWYDNFTAYKLIDSLPKYKMVAKNLRRESM